MRPDEVPTPKTAEEVVDVWEHFEAEGWDDPSVELWDNMLARYGYAMAARVWVEACDLYDLARAGRE